MKILVKSKENNIRVWVPTFLINPRILRFILREAKVEFDQTLNDLLPKLCKAIKDFRRQHKQFLLVEVITKEAERVKITL
ncbi:MAG: hypothetical protein PHU55_00040 [Bacilli bacterium]|nr:hypothetical protein [Bacilli bacterium]